MSVSGMQELKVAEFGGLNTLTDPTNLPVWASPDCQDVEFYPGLVKSRPGTSSVFAALAGNPTVNYLKTFVTPTLAQRLLALDSLGNLYKENPTGTLGLFNQILPNSYANSVSIFGREYMAFSDGKIGTDIPRQYDDTNLDRVSQVGPGAPPNAIDEVLQYTIVASPTGLINLDGGGSNIVASPTGLTEAGNIVTVTLSGTILSPLSKVGDPIKIVGAGVAGYNGSFLISAILSTTQFQYVNANTGLAGSGGGTAQFTLVQITTSTVAGLTIGATVIVAGATNGNYNGSYQIRSGSGTTWGGIGPATIEGQGNSGGGTVSTSGNIPPGIHKVSVLFVTQQGYLTPPAPPGQWTAMGGKRVILTNIPTGPPNITERIIIFTAAGGNNFFYVSNNSPALFSIGMTIGDNTTTTATLDFTDQLLLSGTSADSLFNLLELGECSGVTAYSSRMFWWGERNKVGNFVNLTFDGGFNGLYPLGWTPDPTFALGGGSNTALFAPYWGNAYGIRGDGATAIRGLITQSAYQDINGAAVINPLTGYSVRVRLSSVFPSTQGTFHINLKSISGGFTTTGLAVPLSSISNPSAFYPYTEFMGVLILPSQITGAVPADLVLQVYCDGTPTNGGKVAVDCIEIFPTNQPYNNSQIRASFVEDPESFDGVTGFLNVAPENGQAVKTCFVIRNNLYIVKERSLYVTQDDGTNEPADWSIQEISEKVGTPSVRGVGVGDEWAIIASVDGVYYFAGGLPQKISQEIQPTWNNINWTYGHLINVTVDTKRKRVYIAVPYGSSTVPNKILTLDYTYGFQEPQGDDIQQSQNGIGRRWSPWALSVNSISLILRPDNTQKLFLGNGAATGKIYQLDESNTIFNDDGAIINAYWQPGYFQDGTRLNYGYVIANIVGSGTCNLTLKRGDQSSIIPIRGWIMSLLGYTNMERQIQKQAYRMSMVFGVNTLNSYFSLQGFSIWAAPAIYGPVRGINS